MATYPSILAWEISWTERPGGLESMGSQRVRQNGAYNTHIPANRRPLIGDYRLKGSRWRLPFYYRVKVHSAHHMTGQWTPEMRCWGKEDDFTQKARWLRRWKPSTSKLLSCWVLDARFFFFFFFIYFYWLEANYFTPLQWVLSYIDTNQPWNYKYSPSRSPLPPPSPPSPLIPLGLHSAPGPRTCLQVLL